jgi:hypothetical protein
MLNWTRRGFLRTLAAGAMILPFAGSSVVSDLLLAQPNNSDDQELLDELEHACFEFFWNEADPRSGLVRDRAAANGGDARPTASIAATGFGLTALAIGHHRGYRSPAEITERAEATLDFLLNHAAHHRGFLYHFLEVRSGRRARFSEVSPVDTAILLCGVFTCRQYFDSTSIRTQATEIYERVQWPWALNGGHTFALSWRPEYGFSPLRWDTYCESMMLYLLAMGSSHYPIPADCWRSIRRPWMVYDNYRFISGASPLFIHQFSHAWFDFRGQRDGFADYFANSVLACEAHRSFCQDLSREFPSYSGGVWGITASDSRHGYVAWGGPPLQGPIDGSIVPAAAAGSLPFLYSEAVAVLRLLRSRYGSQIWRRYGFVDAFNPLVGWTSRDVLGIDEGISLLMAENARSQFVWETFMRNPEARLGMEKAGFSPLKQSPVLYAVNQPAALAARNSGKLVSNAPERAPGKS